MYPKNRKSNKSKVEAHANSVHFEFVEELKDVPIYLELEDNVQFLEEVCKDCSDFVIRTFTIEKDIKALALFVDGLIDTDSVNDTLRSLMISESGAVQSSKLAEIALPVSQIQMSDNYGDFFLSVLGGDTGIIIDNNQSAILLGLRGGEMRSVSEPQTESVIRGPREGFNENLRTNTSMLRRKLKTPHLKMKSLTIGKHSNTAVVLAYVDGIIDPAIVKEAEARLAKINIDLILETGYIEELIQDTAFSPFPQMQYSERPDTVAAALLSGKFAIFVDGTPFVLIAPIVFMTLLHSPEDFYERFQISTLIRWLRYLLLFISLFTPALYVAVTTFHHDMVPTTLLLSIAAARETIPFPAVIEALLMEGVFEALREAGLRLPKAVGQAVSIVGALVIGQASVEAGIVSAPMVIVVAITGIASFTLPRFNAAITIRMLRFPFIIVASMFGIYGILLLAMLIVAHMANLRSFGIPYLSPAAPMMPVKWAEILVRLPLWADQKRPAFLGVQNEVRQGNEIAKEQIAQIGGETSSKEDKPADDSNQTSSSHDDSNRGK